MKKDTGLTVKCINVLIRTKQTNEKKKTVTKEKNSNTSERQNNNTQRIVEETI